MQRGTDQPQEAWLDIKGLLDEALTVRIAGEPRGLLQHLAAALAQLPAA